MSATIAANELTKLPDWAISTANQIEALGFKKWSFVWDHPVPDDVKRVQIRDEKNVGQTSEVALYAEAMKRGDKFPPAVWTQDQRMVDGNTRTRAAKKLGWPSFPSFIIHEDFEGAETFTQERYYALGAAFNTGGPKPITRLEMTRLIRILAADPENWTTDKVAEHLHVKRGMVQNVFSELRAEQRAKELGVKLNGAVCPSAKTQLGGKSDKLSDPVFRSVAQLAQDASLSTGDLGDLLRRVSAITTGDEDRLALIATERDVRDPQITNWLAGGKKKPLPSSGIRSAADKLVQHESTDVQALVDGNPNTRVGYLELLDKALVVLTRVVAAQRQING